MHRASGRLQSMWSQSRTWLSARARAHTHTHTHTKHSLAILRHMAKMMNTLNIVVEQSTKRQLSYRHIQIFHSHVLVTPGKCKDCRYCSSVGKCCLTLHDPVNCSMPGFSVHLYLPEFAQTHVHWVSEGSQPPHPVTPFSSCLQFLPASESFPMNQHFIPGGQSTGASASMWG